LEPPPAERSRRANLHHRHSTTSEDSAFYTGTSLSVRGTRISISFSRSRIASSHMKENTFVTAR
jgi:hypothetical protein